VVSGFSEYEVILTSYGTLVSDIEILRNYTFNYVFADESQQIKNIDSQRYQAIRLLHCRNRIAITGTPVENNTFDLYGQLSFTCPGLLGSKQYFRDIYAIPIDKFKDSRRAKELQHKINPFMLRRTKQQVAAELPDKTEVILYCPMGVEQRKAYDAYEKELRDYLEGKRDDDLLKTAMHVLKGITKLRQICDSPALLGEETLYGNASSKIDILMEQLEEKTGRHKILVFSQFVSMLHLVEKELKKRQISFVTLTGSTTNREAVVNEFRENEEVRVFLISLKAGGTGLNLTEADYVYLIDPWWNPAVENQAIDRCYRIGQKKNVIAVRLICPDTVEEKMMKLQAAKKELVDDLIKTDLVALLRTVLASQ
jgi:SNF2 family DNA or RNA helicase